MAESTVVEIYEHEMYNSSNWIPQPNFPWTLADNMPTRAPEEIRLPGSEWSWASNWRIDKQAGKTDSEGWEYASKFERFVDKGRTPKTERGWNDKARRRKWSRIMRQDTRAARLAQFQELQPKIAKGLRSIQSVRVKIEEIVNKNPDSLTNPQMITLVKSVQQNIIDIRDLLGQLDADKLEKANAMAVKKLQNDVAKEEAAIDKAIAGTPLASCLPPKPPQSFGNQPSIQRHVSYNAGTTKKAVHAPLSKHSSFYGEKGASNNTKNNDDDDDDGFGNAPHMEKAFSMPAKHYGSKNNSIGTFRDSDDSSLKIGSMGVRSGKNAFDPNRNNLIAEEPVDAEHRKILEKLVPVSEGEVQEKIIAERAVAIQEIHKAITEVHEMYVDLSNIVHGQREYVETVATNTEESALKTQEALNQILEASRLQQEGNCIIS